MTTELLSFPKDFLWGTASAAYQVEGAANEDGRGPSIWDTFSHTPGCTEMDQHADVAVDQYHRYPEDIRWMQWMGVKAYRLSMSWSRVLPAGDGPANEKGFAYYDRLVDALLAAGITPWITLFHWDLPQALEDRFGGWRSPETARRFADYAAACMQRLSDRVTNWFTINEFVCVTDNGYSQGIFAPGLKLPRKPRNQVRHHALLAHGWGVQAMRAAARQPIRIGIAENMKACVPVFETDEHIAAARTAFRVENARFLTAIMEGRYLDSYLEDEGADAPEFTEAEMTAIGQPLDFIGANLYTPAHIRADAGAPHGYAEVPHPAGYPRMMPDWLFIGPSIGYWATRQLAEIWGVKAVYVTENGCGCPDKPTRGGQVLDTDRIMFLREYLMHMQRATREGWPLKGYFHWSLLDNYEWHRGYAQRFGLLYVNYATLARTPKLSAECYREMIRRNALA
ncbi:MAG: beta-glucosidase [Lentisphaerae bacterium]|nr:beta-glucosidase [Lentisphaerota bacterium]